MAVTIELIRKVCPKDQHALLIKTEEHVIVKGGVDQLPLTTLKMIGVQVKADVDVVYIKAATDDVDKFVSALIEESESILKEVA